MVKCLAPTAVPQVPKAGIVGGAVAVWAIWEYSRNYKNRHGYYPVQGALTRASLWGVLTGRKAIDWANKYIWHKESKKSGKESASDVPSWAKGKKRLAKDKSIDDAVRRIIKEATFPYPPESKEYKRVFRKSRNT